MSNTLILILGAALFFSAWPIIAKYANLDPGWVALILAIGTALVGFTQVSKTMPTTAQILIVLLAGLLNGIGTLFYAKLLNTQGVDISRFIPLTIGLVAVITLVLGSILLKEPLTLKKVSGVLLVVIAVYLLN